MSDNWYPKGFLSPRTDEQLRRTGKAIREVHYGYCGKEAYSDDPEWDLAIGAQDERVPKYQHVPIETLKPIR